MLSNVKQLEKLRNQLEIIEPTDSREFREMIDIGRKVFQQDQELAAFLSVSPPTIKRWVLGEVEPTTPMCRMIYKMLLSRMQQLLHRYQRDRPHTI